MAKANSDPLKQTSRTIAIGDIHGCFDAFDKLLQSLELRPTDTLVTLGDYVDRGPDSPRVVERLIALRSECRLVTLLGNHEAMMLGAMHDQQQASFWLRCGGAETMLSYQEAARENELAEVSEALDAKQTDAANASGKSDRLAEVESSSSFFDMEIIPSSHTHFLRDCTLAYETETHLFVHANYEPQLPIDQQDEFFLLWKHLNQGVPSPHLSGKTAIVGHTPQVSGKPLDLGHVICIDTHCFGGGWLTALDVGSKQVWQANQAGELRSMTCDAN